jgi:NAD(P)H-dependent flavin oxidoreductase YrpB (nitropropane dioxygenase family)
MRLCPPIVQATLGPCDSVRLAAAVSEAGALGTLSLNGSTPEQTRLLLEQLDALTRKPVLLAFTGPWERDEVLSECLAAGHRHFHIFWWNAPRLAPRIRDAGALAFQQVGTLTQAHEALERGVDGLIAQGTRAGGPVRSPLALIELVPALRALFSGPIFAGGGLATQADTKAMLALGADAALFGTRFLLSDEADAPLAHKKLLAQASAAELTLDTRLIGDWPCAPRRRLVAPDDTDVPSLQAGLGLDRITAILPASEIVRELSP